MYAADPYLDPNNPIPMPPPVANTMMSLDSRNSNTANLPSSMQPTRDMGELMGRAASQAPSVINMTNSSDVVIGPMTQYQGPVTIYQCLGVETTMPMGMPRGSLGIGMRRSQKSDEPSPTQFQCGNNSPTWILTVAAVAILFSIVAAVYLTKLTLWKEPEPERPILFGNNYEDKTIPNLGHGHLVIDGSQWGASTHRNRSSKLQHPIPYVMITHVGVQAKPCDNVYNCSIKMRTLQDAAIAELGLPDINANFYLSNDGYVYVGRGWDYVNTYANKSLAVCFLGDFNRYLPSASQFDALQHLLTYGLTEGYLAKDYVMVAHNQTRTTRSPGVYVYKELIKWPRWSACGTNGYPPCGQEHGLPAVWNARQ